jgi:predicted ArsR family transcriptional regulator
MGDPGPDPNYSLSDVLEIFQYANDNCEPRTATEVADELGCARQTAYRKLEKLSEQGTLKTKKIGAKGRVWWLPNNS